MPGKLQFTPEKKLQVLGEALRTRGSSAIPVGAFRDPRRKYPRDGLGLRLQLHHL